MNEQKNLNRTITVALGTIILSLFLLLAGSIASLAAVGVTIYGATENVEVYSELMDNE